MLEGLWTLTYHVEDVGQVGCGVLFAQDGKLFGGDTGHYFTGWMEVEGNKSHGAITITRFDQNILSALGEGTFPFEGGFGPESFVVTVKRADGGSMTVTLTRRMTGYELHR